jgi:hypothetical protein
MALPLLMIAPALWNGYPLLQWDTGGYLARWYEGYLVPGRSTVFGLWASGELPSVRIGKRRFSTDKQIADYISRLEGAA